MHARTIRTADREPLAALLRATSEFHADEVEVALELVDASIADPVGTGYHTWIAELDGAVVGYACLGPTPMTAHTWDLYWLAVGPSARGAGVGRALLDVCDGHVRSRGGRIVRVETSSRDDYDGTVAFYERCGYVHAGRIPAFYREGDDLLVLYRDLAAT